MSRVKDNLRKGKGNSVINGISEQYKVSSSGNISAGDFIKLIEPNTKTVSVNKIKSGEVEVNTNGIYNGEYVIQKFVYDTTSVDSIVNTDEIVAVALNENKALIIYRDPDNNMAGTAMIATIKDQTVEYSNRFVFNTNSINNISATLIDTNKVLVIFSNQSNKNCGTASILSIEDNNIELKDSIIFNTNATSLSKGLTLSKGEILIVFANDDNNSSGCSIIINIDENDNITLSNMVIFCLDSINYLDITALSENKVLVAYSSDNTYNGNVNVLDIYYNSISVGPTFSLNLENMTEDEQDITFISAATIDNYNAVIAYKKVLNNEDEHDYYAIIAASINGTDIILGSKKVLNTNACNLPISVNMMNNSDIVTIYQSFDSGKYYLNASILSIDSTNMISDNISTTVLSNNPINSTLCTINFNKYNCMTFVKSELSDDTSDFECYNIEMLPSTSYNKYTGNVENTGIEYSKSLSGDFANIDTIIIDEKTIMIPFIQPKGWDVEGKQTFANGMYYTVFTDNETKPLSEWDEKLEIFEEDMNINSIDGILLSQNKVLLAYTDQDNSNAKYAIININKDTNDNVKTIITSQDIFIDYEIYIENGSLAKLNDNKVLIVYRSEDDYSVRARIIIINNDNISIGDEYVLGTGSVTSIPSNISTVFVDNNKIYVTYILGSDTNVVTGKLLIIDNDNNIEILDKNFTLDKATNIYENRLMYLEPNTIIHSSEINMEQGTVSNTYDITTEDINIPSLRAGAIINCPYTGSSKEIELPAGKYKLECWGAQGGYTDSIESLDGSECVGGLGGYSTGIITLSESTKLYLYSGGQGKYIPMDDTGKSIVAGGGFNGGGPARICRDESYNLVGGGSGGGGTDIRVLHDSLYSRVIVAGGGSGISHSVHTSYDENGISVEVKDNYNGNFGGGISGEGDNLSGKQNEGGYNPDYLDGIGLFGRAPSYVYNKINYGQTGAGGGWYSGANTISPSTSYTTYNEASLIKAGGGSGYIYDESNVINYPDGCLLKSNYYLEDGKTIDGGESTPFIDPETGASVNGRQGNGYIRITVLESEYDDDQPTRFGNTTLLQFNGENLSIHDSALLLPSDTAGVSDINVLKIDKDLDKTLLITTYNHTSKDTGRVNPLIVPGNVSLNYDKNRNYQISYSGTNNVFKNDDSHDTLYNRSSILNKDLILSTVTTKDIDDNKQNHASELKLQTFKVQNNGTDSLEKFDLVDISKKYITNNSNGYIKYLSMKGINISDNRILVISSVNINNSYSGICEIYNVTSDRKDVISKSEAIRFSPVRTNNISAIMIDANKVLISFNTSTDDSDGVCYAIVGVINNDNTIEFGELLEFAKNDFYSSNPILLSTNKVLLNVGNTINIVYAEENNNLSILASIDINDDSTGIGGLKESNHCPKNIIRLDNSRLLMIYAITDISYCCIITVDSVNNISISDRQLFVDYDIIVQNGNNSINSIIVNEDKVLVEYIVGEGTYSIHGCIVTINKNNSIKVGPREILVENIDQLQQLNLHNIDNKVLFTYVTPDTEDYTINYSVLTITDNIISKGNIYSLNNSKTTIPFTDMTSVDNDTLLFYTLASNSNNVICLILTNLVKDVLKYNKGCVTYSDTLLQSTLVPIIDYSLVSDSVNNFADTPKAIKISDDRVFITYIDSFTKYATAKVAKITNQSIEYYNSFTIYNNESTDIITQLLSDGRVFIALTDRSDNKAKFTIASVNDNGEISFTNIISRSLSENVYGGKLSMVEFSDNKLFIAYPDGTAEIVNITDNNILFTTIEIFDNVGELDNINLQFISNSKLLLVYKNINSIDDTTLYTIKSRIIDIVGNSIKIGDIEVIYQSNTDFDGTTSIIQTDYYKHKFLISINSIGYLNILSVNLDELSILQQMNTTYDSCSPNVYISYINENNYLVLYNDNFDTKGLLLNIDGTEINKSNNYLFNNGAIEYLNALQLSNEKIFIILNEKVSNSIITSATVILFNIDKKIVVKYDGIDKPNGIAKTDGVANGIIDVYITGNIQQ